MLSRTPSIEEQTSTRSRDSSSIARFFYEAPNELLYLVAGYLLPLDLAIIAWLVPFLRPLCLPLVYRLCGVIADNNQVLSVSNRICADREFSGFLALPAVQLSRRYENMRTLSFSISGEDQGRDFRRGARFCETLKSVRCFRIVVFHESVNTDSEAKKYLPGLIQQLRRLRLKELDFSWSDWRLATLPVHPFRNEFHGIMDMDDVEPLDTLETVSFALWGQSPLANSWSARKWLRETLRLSPLRSLSFHGETGQIPSVLNDTKFPHLTRLRMPCHDIEFRVLEMLLLRHPGLIDLELDGIVTLPANRECVRYRDYSFQKSLERLTACPDFVRYIVSSISMESTSLKSVTLQLSTINLDDEEESHPIAREDIARALFHVSTKRHIESVGFTYDDRIMGAAPVSVRDFMRSYPSSKKEKLRSTVARPVLRHVKTFVYSAVVREVFFYRHVPLWLVVAIPGLETLTLYGVDKDRDCSRVTKAMTAAYGERMPEIRM